MDPSLRYLSEQRSVEGDGVEAVHRPHGDVQIHEQPLLLLRVDGGPNPLRGEKVRDAEQNEVASRRQKVTFVIFPSVFVTGK